MEATEPTLSDIVNLLFVRLVSNIRFGACRPRLASVCVCVSVKTLCGVGTIIYTVRERGRVRGKIIIKKTLQRKRVCQRCQHCDAMVGDDICATYEYVFVFSPLLPPLPSPPSPYMLGVCGKGEPRCRRHVTAAENEVDVQIKDGWRE